MIEVICTECPKINHKSSFIINNIQRFRDKFTSENLDSLAFNRTSKFDREIILFIQSLSLTQEVHRQVIPPTLYCFLMFRFGRLATQQNLQTTTWRRINRKKRFVATWTSQTESWKLRLMTLLHHYTARYSPLPAIAVNLPNDPHHCYICTYTPPVSPFPSRNEEV